MAKQKQEVVAQPVESDSKVAVALQAAPLPVASIAAAAQAEAEIKAAFTMALARPRAADDARTAILHECKRPRFAAKASYLKPVDTRTGKTVEGPSIRFAEMALRLWQNIRSAATVIHDDEQKCIVRVTQTDLENNTSFAQDVTVTKTVERRTPRSGQKVISKRTNSEGQTVYLVVASEDEVRNKTNNYISRAIRNNGLRLIPEDIIDEAMELVAKTQAQDDAGDPDAANKALADAFADKGITVAALGKYLGHPLGQITGTERRDLRAIWTTINDDETTWSAVMEARVADQAKGKKPSVKKVEAPTVDTVKAAAPDGAFEQEQPEATKDAEVTDGDLEQQGLI